MSVGRKTCTSSFSAARSTFRRACPAIQPTLCAFGKHWGKPALRSCEDGRRTHRVRRGRFYASRTASRPPASATVACDGGRCRRSLLALAVFRNVASGNSRRSLGEQGLFEVFWRLLSRCVSATETWPMFTNVASTLHVFFNTASARVAWIDRDPYGFDRRAGR